MKPVVSIVAIAVAVSIVACAPAPRSGDAPLVVVGSHTCTESVGLGEVVALVLLIRVVLTRRDETHETPKDTLGVAVVVLALGLVLATGFVAIRSSPAGGGR